MTHLHAAIRILSALGSIWAFVAFRTTIRRENERRNLRDRIDTVIRGGR